MKRKIEATDPQGQSLASCCLWWGDNIPKLEGYSLGIIGAYDSSSDDAGLELLEKATEQLIIEGCDLAIGPMDGDTWHSYRFVTKSSKREPFFLEPRNPESWPAQFQSAGFGELAQYSSSELNLTLPTAIHPMNTVGKRLTEKGIIFRNMELSNFEKELQNIYEVSIASFVDNFLYTPISFKEFAAMYEKIRPLIVPSLNILAEDSNGKPLGFAFSYPDGETLIVKTLAVVPDRRFAGLGNLLINRIHEAGIAAGFKKAIHALQHESNTSLKITSRYGATKFRTYTLFSKELS